MSQEIQSTLNTKWSRTTRLWMTLILLVVTGWLFIVALPFFEAILIAALLAFLIDPIVTRLMKRLKISRSKASTMVYAIFLLILGSIPTGLGTLTYSLARNWFADFPAATAELQRFFSRPIVILGYVISPSVVFNDLSQSFAGALGSLPGGSLDILSGITTNLMWALLILVSLYYFLKDGPKLKPWVCSLFLPQYRPEIDRLIDEIVKVWGLFLRAQLFIFFVLAFLIGLSSLAMIWLYQTGLIQFSTIGLILASILVYSLIQQVDNLWLRPQLLGHQLHLHPGVVVVGLIGALALSGILGALLIIPAIASGKVLAQFIHSKMLGIPPWPDWESASAEDSDTSENRSTNAPA